MASKDVRAESERKQDIAWKLSLAGANPREIAASKDPDGGGPLFKDARGAAQALRAATRRYSDDELAEGKPSMEDLFNQDIDRLDRMQRALFPAANSGDVNAAREIRQIIQTRAQLRGYIKGLAVDPAGAGDPIDQLAAKRAARRAASE